MGELVASEQPVAWLAVLSAEMERSLTELMFSLREASQESIDPVPLVDAVRRLAQVQGALSMIDQPGLAALAHLVRDQLITSGQPGTTAQYSSEFIVQRFQTFLRKALEHLLHGNTLTTGELLRFWHQQVAIGGPTTLQPSLLVKLDVEPHILHELLPDGLPPDAMDPSPTDPDQSLLKLLRAQDDLTLRQATQPIADLFACAAARVQPHHEYVYWQAVQACLIEYTISGGDATRIKKIAAAGVRLLRLSDVESTSTLEAALRSLTRDALFELAQRPVQSALARAVVRIFRIEQQFAVPAHGITIDTTSEHALAAWTSTLDALISAIEVKSECITDSASWEALIDAAASAPLPAVVEPLKDILAQITSQPPEPIRCEGLAAGLCCLRDEVDSKVLLVAIQAMKRLLISHEPRECLNQLGQLSRLESAHRLLMALSDAIQADMTQVEQLLDAEPQVDVVTASKASVAALNRIAGALQLLGLSEEREQVMLLCDAIHGQAADTWLNESFAQQWVFLQTTLVQLPWQKTLNAKQAHQSAGGLDSIFIEEARTLLKGMRDYAANDDFARLAHVAHTLGGCSATVGFSGLAELALALESTLEQLLARGSMIDASRLETVLVTVSGLLEGFADQGIRGEASELVQCLRDDLLAPTPNHAVQSLDLAADQFDQEAVEPIRRPAMDDVVMDTAHCVSSIVNASVVSAQAAGEGDEEKFSVSISADTPSPSPSATNPIISGPNRSDEHDEHDEHDELYELFKLEAADLLPQLEYALRQWEQHPEDGSQAAQLLRVLHTLKGSARMAGQDELGTEFHQAEAEVSTLLHQSSSDITHAIAELLRQVDFWMYTLTQPSAASPENASLIEFSSATEGDVSSEASLVTDITSSPKSVTPPELEAPPDKLDSSPLPPKMRAEKHLPMLRVRADRLAKFADTSAELWRSNARLREVLQEQRRSFDDMSDDLSRLRAQLRELEIEAESRVLARSSQGTATDFDPLEFDRYTRLHELTRMMAESITDIVGAQREWSVQSEQLTTATAEQLRDLRRQQAELQALRAQPLHSVEARLRHVLQQAAREVGCEVSFVLRQGSVEIERVLLDRLLGPLEHLLRNAVVHGIEQVQQRQSVAKASSGQVVISAAMTGNELQLIVQDDGRGLDMQRIRQRALEAGLLQAGDDIDERALSELIFAPGLSTATEVTTLSGRGIGMDAVRAELHAMGGQIEVQSEAGQGCRFTLRIPVGLTSVMVVLVRAGQWRIGLPAALVKQALQIDTAKIRSDGQQHQIDWQGISVPLRHLGQTLGDTGASVNKGRVPVAIMSDGDKTIALQLDAIEGQRELIIKHPGPQLLRVPGLSGASVLADGAIALILHPFRLPETAPPPLPSVTERQSPTVLVVDDSLTVRRASQRLLERHGYAVALARDGVEALAYVRNTQPALILLDIEMPRMDGFELLATLRDDERWRDIPVVMITSRMADRHRQRALQLGANAYMGKPYREETLLAQLTQLLADEQSTQSEHDILSEGMTESVED